MSFTIALPTLSEASERRMEIIDGRSTAVQRHLRRGGARSFERQTTCALLASFSQQRSGFTFFDVGANIGYYSTLCGLLFSPRSIVAFEPTPSTADLARRIARANGVDTVVEEVAVASRAGQSELHLSDQSDASNSLVEGARPSRDSVSVDTITLDGYAQQTGLAPDVVKIDVEGLEAEVLAGARRTLEAHRPTLVVEALFIGDRDIGNEIEQQLTDLEYHRYRLVKDSAWKVRRRVRAARFVEGRPRRDWLLVPEPVSDAFKAAYGDWSRALRECSRRRNEQVP